VLVTLPADATSAITEVSALAALLEKNGWKAAAFLALCSGQGIDADALATQINAKGWSANVITRNLDAWNRAAEDDLVPYADDLAYGDAITVPTTGWSDYYIPPTEADGRYQITDKDSILAAAKARGLGGSKAVDIAKNTKSMAAAIHGSEKVSQAAVQALVEKGDIRALSQATAAVAMNRQVERNRKRLAQGQPKPRTAQQGTQGLADPGLAASMSVKGLADALRALVTTFPTEWAALTDEAKSDVDFHDLCEETLDKIEIAVSNARLLLSGGVTDDALEALLDGERS
jgi:hypothetical protein